MLSPYMHVAVHTCHDVSYNGRLAISQLSQPWLSSYAQIYKIYQLKVYFLQRRNLLVKHVYFLNVENISVYEENQG